MVRAWLASVKPLYYEECYREYYEKLPAFRKRKADALSSGKNRESVGKDSGRIWTA